MRIISRFHDYYDSVQAHGQDDQVRYLRRAFLAAGTLPDLPWEAPLLDRRGHRQGPTGTLHLTAHHRSDRSRPWFTRVIQESDLSIERAYLLVGGKAHAVWVDHGGLGQVSNNFWSRHREPPEAWSLGAPEIWGDPSVRNWADRWRAARVAAEPALANVEPVLRLRHDGGNEDERLHLEDLTDGDLPVTRPWREHEERHQAFLAKDWSALHLAFESPLLLIQDLRRTGGSVVGVDNKANAWVLVNPRLSDLRWGARQDAYTVFQAIAQFIGGVMPGGQSPMVTLSDQSLVDKHGIDRKYGFRTRPADYQG
jgi:hypothetical protein